MTKKNPGGPEARIQGQGGTTWPAIKLKKKKETMKAAQRQGGVSIFVDAAVGSEGRNRQDRIKKG